MARKILRYLLPGCICWPTAADYKLEHASSCIFNLCFLALRVSFPSTYSWLFPCCFSPTSSLLSSSILASSKAVVHLNKVHLMWKTVSCVIAVLRSPELGNKGKLLYRDKGGWETGEHRASFQRPLNRVSAASLLGPVLKPLHSVQYPLSASFVSGTILGTEDEKKGQDTCLLSHWIVSVWV